MAEGSKVERILDTRVAKYTSGKECMEFLVKWKDHLTEDSTLMSVPALQKPGFFVEDLMSRDS